jgi:hypothetical protein
MKASQCNRREGGFRAATYCKAYARSGAKPLPTSGLAGRTAVVETANGTSRMPVDDCRWPYPAVPSQGSEPPKMARGSRCD